ncbi:IS110 family transposase [Acidaminobacter sp. JC074]|uniref:IS110 family transposase n=1 Tax=Acidaminobacter sp. JC074 TaxID=2530199 RepID=UPI001F1155A2|nr:IS110 family transposase [Acidaminobacter sp. JC074]MCH4891427.1 IS110 family transposase [Acidaminobacter sp. JC074]
MNYSKAEKLNQITDKTLIVGIDVSKNFHVARAQDFRGIEFGKSITFNNNHIGFTELGVWIGELMHENSKETLIIGLEPTGPYWINLARYLRQNNIKVVTVNPMHVKKIKELDDNSQTKTDFKDSKIIAQLVKDVRFSEPNLLVGDYESLRNAKNLREVMIKDLCRIKNQMHNWLDRYFPEYQVAYKDWEAKSFLTILKLYRFPSKIANVGSSEIYNALPGKLRKGVGLNKITKLVNAAQNSIGTTVGLEMAEEELKYLLKQYHNISDEISALELKIENICRRLPEVQKLLKIKGMGLSTTSGIISEIGDIRNYSHPDQLIKMAGLSLIENSSGKKKGQTTISKRGRSDLRKFMYQVIFSMLAKNEAFRELYKYFTERKKNQLKGRQAIMALARKLLRIIYSIVINNSDYDERKMLSDIKRPKEFLMTA